MIHELAHQAAYAPGDSDFNEALAIVVETEGVRRWFARENCPGDLGKFLALRKRQGEAAGLMIDARRRLDALYGEELELDAMRKGKVAEFARLRESLAAGGHPASGEFNNARLVAVATYERCVPALRAELDRLGNDLPAFYSAMNLLVRDPTTRAKICPPP
jgi:predicted aminopeptidase